MTSLYYGKADGMSAGMTGGILEDTHEIVNFPHSMFSSRYRKFLTGSNTESYIPNKCLYNKDSRQT